MKYLDPNTGLYFGAVEPRLNTKQVLAFFEFKNDAGNIIIWTPGQLEIIDCILNRSSPDGKKRIEINCSTQYGKSIAVAAALVIRASLYPEKWAIVAGTDDKAKIIMEYVVMFSLNNEIVRSQLTADTPLDRLRMKKSSDRMTFKRKGEIRVFSAGATLVNQTSKALMGFGSPNVVSDESSLIPDKLQATVMRMLGGNKDNFLVKIGNPFFRNHFYRTWMGGKYHRIFIDYNRAIDEGRYTKDFIEEMRSEAMFNVLYECKFPLEDSIDLKGWLPLLTESDLARAFVKEDYPFGVGRLGCDVAGGGRNFSVIAHRSYNVAHLIYQKNESDTMMFVGNILHFQNHLKVQNDDIFVDRVGIGKGTYDRLAEQRSGVRGVSGAEEPSDKKRFYNLRAEMYWRLREWILQGGKLKEHEGWNQLLDIKYKPDDSSGRIKIMGKEEMLRNGIQSPDCSDALSLTFARPDEPQAYKQSQSQRVVVNPINVDPYDKVVKNIQGIIDNNINDDPYE